VDVIRIALVLATVTVLLGVVAGGAACRIERAAVGEFSAPLNGRSSADVRLTMGNGSLDVTNGAAPGTLLSGVSTPEKVSLVSTRPAGATTVVVPAAEAPQATTVRLASAVRFELEIERGAGPATLDLSAVDVEVLDYRATEGALQVRLAEAAPSQVVITTGRSAISLDLPESLGVRMLVEGRGPVYMPAGWYRVGDAYESPNFATAERTCELSISRQSGPIRIQLR
jgi:hypothetical protein